MLKSLLIGAASAAALGAGVAHADVQTVYRSGAWETIAGVASDGQWMCGVKILGADKLFAVKWFMQTNAVVIHLTKTGWEIPTGTKLRMSVQFDQNPPWIGTATAQNDNLVELYINGAVDFLRQIGPATSMIVSFPDGNETPWTANMTGSNAAVLHMAMCIQQTMRTTAPTQPFSSQARPPVAPTQPYARRTPPAQQPVPTEGRNI